MKLLSLVLAVLMITIAFPTAVFATSTTIELTTRSALLVDRSGSIKDQDEVNELLKNIYQTQFDFVGYFDENQLSLDPAYSGGGNSAICETVDEVAKLGYTHITVITDGQQWPKDYSSLGVYSDLDLTIVLVGDKEEDSEELINSLKGRMINSNLKVVIPGSPEKVILNDYQPPVYEVQLPDNSSVAGDGAGDTTSDVDINNSNGDTFIENIKKGYFPWWLVLLLAALIAAIFDFIHELITRGRDEEEEKDTTAAPALAPTMTAGTVAAVAQKLREGEVEYYVDNSTSFEHVFVGAAEAAKSSGTEYAMTFGREVKKRKSSELSGLVPQDQTRGWEALEKTKGGRDAVILSDMKFNGKAFDESAFAGKAFKKVTVFAPSGYNADNVENLKKIADEVEVLPLQ